MLIFEGPTPCFEDQVSFGPNLLWLDAQLMVSLVFILAIHLALTSSFVGHVSSVRFSHTLWFLRCQISINDSAIKILKRQLSPGFGFPFCILKLARVILPMLFILGHDPGFLLSHSSFASFHIMLCPVALQESIMYMF